MLNDGICDRRSIPGLSTIQEEVSRKIVMSYKKLSVVPSDSQTNAQVERCNEYLELTSKMDPSKLHFLDESSVIKTTGNRCSPRTRRREEWIKLRGLSIKHRLSSLQFLTSRKIISIFQGDLRKIKSIFENFNPICDFPM